MIKSMTGFGRSEVLSSERKISVEMKSVNHRYLDINIRMPKKFSFSEASIRSLVKEYAERGKLDIFITCEDYTADNLSLRYNRDIAASYYGYLKEMAGEFSLENDITVSRLSRYPEVFTLEEQDADENELWTDLEKALREALGRFSDSRIKEGENLKKDLLEKLDEMLDHVGFIEERAPEILKEYREKLYERIRELVADASIDDSRILTEAAVYADKICVDEELVRLKSHINTMSKALSSGGGVGRKLDFIAQEMNREANTILSKANDLATSDHAIELKTGIEKVREQIQNIE
ncbi:MAG TPA: YicC family protein [Lachnospiraceae bacterium]|nr:YicC family protein [Lachnospiraceae bacterium]